MAETDIAIDIISPASTLSEFLEFDKSDFKPRPRLALRTLGIIALDVTVAAGAALGTFCLFHPVAEAASSSVIVTIAWLTLCMSFSFFERGLYAAPEIMSPRLNWRKMALSWLQAVAVGALLTFCFAAVADGVTAAPHGMARTLPGPWLPTLLLAGFVAISLARLACLRVDGGPASLNRTVIIGEPGSMHDLLLRIRSGRRRGFDVVGIFEHEKEPQDTAVATVAPLSARRSFLGLPLFSGLDALERMIRKDAVDTVLVALPWSAGEQARAIVQRVSMAPVNVYVYPGMNAFDIPPRRAASVFELPLLMACARPIDGWGAVIKRAEDIVLAIGLLVFIAPVMLAIAALIKLTSKGPIFFRQRRLGYNNRVIEVLKFRSMFAHLADADAHQQASRGDKRVTRVGAWLRKASLDELPQLLNVLKGDMSLVGPRPHALATTAGGLALQDAVPIYPSRHRVKPGITGWAQVNGYRGALDSVEKIVHRVNHDLYYIENWSLALDLKILWLTIKLIFADDNAF
ncbi:exopolysaccharide biosynthesis polyprenyl glycosylphosphotransferase [Rhodopila sp.]|uniref:exopolysaccharide biosynthesis polyprenyl glycosylphosphotransferase n=1 Tax=Rhodopila sp. TaxID=2480087 RepID=UPI003D0C49B3